MPCGKSDENDLNELSVLSDSLITGYKVANEIEELCGI